jgi:hypothetical protein
MTASAVGPASAGRAAGEGRSQPRKLRVQAQTGLVGRFGRRAGSLGHRLNRGLEFAEAQIAGVGSAPTRPELAALFDSITVSAEASHDRATYR